MTALVPGSTDDAAVPAAGDSPLWRAVLLLALPVLAQQFLLLSVGLSDRFLAGHFRPESRTAAADWESAAEIEITQVAYQAAQTTANYLTWFISSYTVLVSVGSTALVARFVGAGDRARAVHVTNQSILLAVVLGGVGSLLGLSGLNGLVWLLQLRGQAAVFAAQYLTPLFALLVFQMIESAGIACLVGAGDTVTGLLVTAGVALVNLPLAWSLCLGLGPFPAIGFPGIALGTALSHVLGCTAVLLTLLNGRAGLRLASGLMRPDGDLLRRLLRISIPAGVDSLSVVAGQLWFLSLVNRLGDVASGAHGIALGWEALGYLSGGAFGTAAMALVGQNLGARRPDRAERSGWVACGLGVGVMSLMGAVFFLFAPQMFALFCPHPEQRPVIDAGVPVLRLVAFAMPALACCIVFTYSLRGAGDTRVPVLFTWVGFLVVRIPLTYLLTDPAYNPAWLGSWAGASPGLFGAWLAMFADLWVRGLFFLARFASGRWKAIKV